MLLRLLIVSSCFLFVVKSENCNGFVDNAADWVKVNYKQTPRGGAVLESYDVAEIKWKPADMLGENSCYDPNTAVLYYKSSNDPEFIASSESQKPSGEFAKWSLKIKPCLEYSFRITIVKTEDIVASFEIPFTLGPADPEKIEDLVPEPVSKSGVEPGANSAVVSWTPSDCASEYEFNYIESGSSDYVSLKSNDPFLTMDNLKPCTRYEATIYAIRNGKYSDELASIVNTKPRLDAITDLEPEISTGMDSVTVRWPGYGPVACIGEYSVLICHSEECKEPVIVKKTGLPTLEFETSGLEPCTQYTLKITPIFPDTEVESKTFSFETRSPLADSAEVGEIASQPLTSGSVMVSWSSVKCASRYSIYKKSVNDEDWELSGQTIEDSFVVDNLASCTQYTFAVSAVLNEEESPKSISEIVVSDIDEEFAFEAPELNIDNKDTLAEISWVHAPCITSYIVKACEPSAQDCLEKAVVPEEGSTQLNHIIEGLFPCTQYTLEIIPVIPGKDFTARLQKFSTTNGELVPPNDLTASLKEYSVELRWAESKCGTGYKVYSKLEDSQTEEKTKVPSVSISNLVPCQTYYYAVSNLVDERESPLSEWISVVTPPRADLAPNLKILNTERDNMTLRLESTSPNAKCLVKEYELTYGLSGAPFSTLNSRPEADKDIVLSFAGASSPTAVIIGRVLYSSGGEEAVWSAQVSSGAPEGAESSSEPGDPLVPIVVGAIVAVVLFIAVVLLILRRRKTRSNYDTEKAEHSRTDETQKLNDSNPESA